MTEVWPTAYVAHASVMFQGFDSQSNDLSAALRLPHGSCSFSDQHCSQVWQPAVLCHHVHLGQICVDQLQVLQTGGY